MQRGGGGEGAAQADCNIFSINTNTPRTCAIFCVSTQHAYTPLALNESEILKPVSLSSYLKSTASQCSCKNAALVSYNDYSETWSSKVQSRSIYVVQMQRDEKRASLSTH